MKKLLIVAALACAPVFLSGCATIKGLEITDEERAACQVEGCSAWTMAELEMLYRAAMAKGYQAGKGSL